MWFISLTVKFSLVNFLLPITCLSSIDRFSLINSCSLIDSLFLVNFLSLVDSLFSIEMLSLATFSLGCFVPSPLEMFLIFVVCCLHSSLWWRRFSKETTYLSSYVDEEFLSFYEFLSTTIFMFFVHFPFFILINCIDLEKIQLITGFGWLRIHQLNHHPKTVFYLILP